MSLTTPPHVNLSLMTCFADTNVSQGSVATYAGAVGFSNNHLTANLPRSLPENFFFKNRFRIVATSLWPCFFGPPCTHGRDRVSRRRSRRSRCRRRRSSRPSHSADWSDSDDSPTCTAASLSQYKHDGCDKWPNNSDERPHRRRTAAREFILKPRWRRDTLPPADKSAAPFCCGVYCTCVHSLMHFNGDQMPKISPSHGGSGLLHYTWYLGLTQVHIPNGISISSALLTQFMVMLNTETRVPRNIGSVQCRPHLSFHSVCDAAW